MVYISPSCYALIRFSIRKWLFQCVLNAVGSRFFRELKFILLLFVLERGSLNSLNGMRFIYDWKQFFFKWEKIRWNTRFFLWIKEAEKRAFEVLNTADKNEIIKTPRVKTGYLYVTLDHIM